MSKGRLYPRVPIKTERTRFIVFGHEFGFDPSSLESRANALSQAETFGEQNIKAFERRVGRPASLRETLTLKADAPPPEPYSGSLRRERPVVNPYRQRMDEVARTFPEIHPDQRERKQKRLDALTRAADEWDRQHQETQTNAAVKSSPDYLRAMAYADKRLDALRLDPGVSQESVEAAEQAKDDLQAGKLSPGEFFQTLTTPTATAKNLYETEGTHAAAD